MNNKVRHFLRGACAVAAASASVMGASPTAHADNYACIFYFSSFGDTFYGPNEISPSGDSWIMQGQSPAYSPGNGLTNWWGKPLYAATHGDGTIKNNYRFYFNGDPTQTNNALLDYHADLLSRMGVDFVVLDFTNGAADFPDGPTYVSATKALCNRWQARMAAGLPTPKIAFFAYNEDTLNTIQSTYFANYNSNLFFNYLGKKLVLVARPNMSLGQGDAGQPAIPTSGAFANYTCRHCWGLQTNASCWQFKVASSTPPSAFMYNGTPEQMSVAVSTQSSTMTTDGVNPSPGAFGRNDGQYFNTYMAAAQQTKPTFTFLHSWNEWNAGNFGSQSAPYFVDQWLEAYSSDIEPMAGGHGYQYYDLASQQVARLKGNFPIISGQSYTLYNQNSGLALDVPGGTNVHGTQLQQWPANGASAQAWTFNDLGDGYWTITNAGNGLALDDYGWGTTDGTAVDQWDLNSAAVQQWSLRPSGDGSWKIVNRNSGLCLGVSGASTSWGAQTVQWDDNGASDHNWYPQPYIPDGSYKITATTSGNALDVNGLTHGSLIQLHPYVSGANQKWNFHNNGNGTFSIRNANGQSLDATGCSPSNGTQAEIWDYNGLICQQWIVTPVGGGAYRISTAQAKPDGTRDVLDGAGCSGATGTNVLLWSWGGGGCQQTWNIQPAN